MGYPETESNITIPPTWPAAVAMLPGGRMPWANVTNIQPIHSPICKVRIEGICFNLFLLSPVSHWAVLINTMGGGGGDELKFLFLRRVLDATNFADRRRGAARGVSPLFTPLLTSSTLHRLQKSA